MKKILALTGLLYLPNIGATPWPILGDPEITRCMQPQCAVNVHYRTSGTMMVDIVPIGTPNPRGSKLLYALGVHCQKGNGMLGELPFWGCRWAPGSVHAPSTVGKCELKSVDSWELTDSSTCAVSNTWGVHTGAGPGGECVVFTQQRQDVNGAIATPWGYLTATQAANSGNRFCSKPLPPNVTCEISLPSIIDHGQLQPGGTSRREDDGVMECGGAPKVDVLVNGNGTTNGVRIEATPVVVSPTQLRVVSEVTAGPNAGAGLYSATYVFVASPY